MRGDRGQANCYEVLTVVLQGICFEKAKDESENAETNANLLLTNEQVLR
jgi:hypothetical protein